MLLTEEDEDLPVTTHIDSPDPSLSITNLLKRWDISKPTLYGYFKALSITPVRYGRAAYITLEQQELVGSLKARLQRSKNTSIENEIRAMRALGIYIKLPQEPDGEDGVTSKTRSMGKAPHDFTGEDTESFVENLNGERKGFSQLISYFWEVGFSNLLSFLKALGRAEPPVSLHDYELLERSAEKGWTLTTSRLAAILRLNPATVGSMGGVWALRFPL